MFHVLVIEDDPRIVRQMRGLVAEAGIASVDVATTEQEALDAALRRRPSVILFDGILADGTGPAACSQIRKKQGEIPVIFITASPALCTGHPYAFAVLSKPVPSGRLLSALDSALAQ